MRLGLRFSEKQPQKSKSLGDLEELDQEFESEFDNVQTISQSVEQAPHGKKKLELREFEEVKNEHITIPSSSHVLSEYSLRQIFRNRKVPIVTLDERFINLFPEGNMTPKQLRLRDELISLMKEQSRNLEEIKALKRYKSQLMQEIVENMEVDQTPLGRLKERKLAKNRRLIEEINQKLCETEDHLEKLPGEIHAKNEELMGESLQLCYESLSEKNRKKKAVNEEIKELELRLRQLKKQKSEIEKDYRGTYTYLYDMLGTDVMRKIDEEQDLI